MLVLNPDVVRFEAIVWEDAVGVAVDRVAARLVEEWTDFGPHAGLVDVAEVRTTVKVVRRVRGAGSSAADGEAQTPTLGALGELTFYTGVGGSDAGRRRVTVRCVVTSVKTDLTAPGEARSDGAAQTITFVGVSEDGASDPVNIKESLE